MPTYEYEPIDQDCDQCHGRFEHSCSMDNPPLESCPTCDKACRRVFSGFSVGKGTRSSSLSPDNLARHGFTSYSKVGDGQYAKTAGEGPTEIRSPGSES